MKIIFINRYFYPDRSATSVLLTDLARHCAGNGMKVSVIASRQLYDDPGASLPGKETMGDIQVLRPWSSQFGRYHLVGRFLDLLSFYVSASLAIAATIARGDILVAKTDPPLISLAAAVLCKIRRASLVNWIQDLYPEVAISGPWRRPLSFLRDWSLINARVNVVISDDMRAYLAGRNPALKNSALIPNWSDGTRIFPVANEKNTLRNAWGLAGEFVVGYAGNLGRIYDFGPMMKAAEELRAQPNVKFLFIGEGVQKEKLRREIERRKLSNVLLKPRQSDEQIAETLGAADIHIVCLEPGLEPFVFPSKIYAIMAAGRPLVHVGAPKSALARLLSDFAAGHTVPADEAETHLPRLIVELSRDRAGMARLGQNARALFESEFERQHGLLRWDKVLFQPGTPGG